MDKLLALLRSLDPASRETFGIACGSSYGYLRKAISANQLLGAAICVSIERESFGQVTRKDLRPDDWAAIWPELVEAA